MESKIWPARCSTHPRSTSTQVQAQPAGFVADMNAERGAVYLASDRVWGLPSSYLAPPSPIYEVEIKYLPHKEHLGAGSKHRVVASPACVPMLPRPPSVAPSSGQILIATINFPSVGPVGTLSKVSLLCYSVCWASYLGSPCLLLNFRTFSLQPGVHQSLFVPLCAHLQASEARSNGLSVTLPRKKKHGRTGEAGEGWCLGLLDRCMWLHQHTGACGP